MYVWPGVFAIWSALIAGLASVITYVRVERGRSDLLPLARTTYTAFAVSVVTSAAILMTLLLQHRFDVAYVNSYSSLELPTHYLVSTFWAGQEGSFLLWCFWGSLIGLFVWRSAKEQEAPVMVVYLSTFLGIIAILCKQSPFKLLPPPAPADGVGLNPLLQDPWMVIHPPVMFLGFASLSVPFSFAIAALWKKRWDGWITRALPWALLTFLTLGTAILMGGYWAYKTLGWGGYWGWDPVENTSLVPWLFTAALVHGMYLQRVRKRHRKINLVLACTAFAAILYGTFLTRSGVLADFSVHSFIDLGITGWLVAILGTFITLSVALLAWRWRSIPAVHEEEPPLLSRSVMFILGIAVFCALAAVILLGTSAPILTRLSGTPSQVQTGFYGKTTTPAGFLLVLLAGLVPFVGWKGVTGADLWKSSRRSLAVAAILTLTAFVLGASRPNTLLLLFTAFFAADMNLRAVLRKASNGKLGGAGGYLAHAGVGIMLAGIVVSGSYARSERVTLPVNVPKKVGDTTLTFLRVVPGAGDRKTAMEVRVETAKGKAFYAYPKMYENSKTGQLMVNPSIRSSPVMDLYIAPQQYDPGQPQIVGRDVRLQKGTSTSIEGTGFTLPRLQRRPGGHDARRAEDPGADRPHHHAAGRVEPRRDAALRVPSGYPPGRGGGRRRAGLSERKDARPRRLAERRLRRPAPDGRLEEPGRRVPGRDRRVPVDRRDAQAAHRARLGRLLRDDGRRPPRVRQAFGRGAPRRPRSLDARDPGGVARRATGPALPAHTRSPLG